MKKIILKCFLIIFSPFTLLSALWIKFVLLFKTKNISDNIFMKLGVLPISDHYYQPMINPGRDLRKSLRLDRNLPGINFNLNEQLDLLSKLNYNQELIQFPMNKPENLGYYYNNNSYMSGDSEYLYSIIRHLKPNNIIEIGSGYSTLMANSAILKNKELDKNYKCEHICIEPYEQDWLNMLEIKLIRERVEDVDVALFKKLQNNDILFIDSSHIIRPQGDVLFEYLELLPILNPGVVVHIHDIFSPKDYLDNWIINDHLFWNEQYLLEAFLSFNNDFKIIGALNFLSKKHKDKFSKMAPIFANQMNREPGAFWIQKRNYD
jgi:hypothetical protein